MCTRTLHRPKDRQLVKASFEHEGTIETLGTGRKPRTGENLTEGGKGSGVDCSWSVVFHGTE